MVSYVVELTLMFSEEWLTPEIAMEVIFNDIMPETHPEKLENSDWCVAYLEVLENLTNRGADWCALIKTMPSWCAYCVTRREMNMQRKLNSERGTGMFFVYWAETLKLFMTSRDIPFEIDERLVETELHLLCLQERVLLRAHLKSAVEFELLGPTRGYSLSRGASSSSGHGSSKRAKYWAPRRVNMNGKEWPIGTKLYLDAIFGRSAEQWREDFFA
jgi:hypothetical protein